MRDPADELSELEAQGLRRTLRRLDSPQRERILLSENGECLNFSSNDYLGLASSELLKDAFRQNIDRFGAGSGSSRLVCGTMAPHLDLEAKLATLKHAEAALTFSSGFAAATGMIPAVCGKDDFIILDKLCHASLIDGARLSAATMRVFPHNNLAKLEELLDWAAAKSGPKSRVLVITESIFSMDGDRAPLAEICELKTRYGALLLVDEAHAFGVIGPRGKGLAAELSLEGEVDLQMGTFSKAVGLSGGYLCASRDLVDLAINRARSFIYSTAPAPALAATVSDALDLITGKEGEERMKKLHTNIRTFSETHDSGIFPLVIGENEAALEISDALLTRGFLVPAIRFPTVPRGTARLRITFSASHSVEQILSLKKALAELGQNF